MQAVIWTGPRAMELRDEPEPTPGPGQVLLRVDAVGICGSELSGFLGHNSLRVPPLVMGHEFAGTVVALGPETNGVAVGEAVIANPLISCGGCTFCRSGHANLCPLRKLIGAHLPGAFAEFVVVPAASCTPTPPGLSAVAGSLAEPLACGIRAAVMGDVRAGSTVAIFGAGPIGLMCVSACRRLGAEVCLVVDMHSPRLATASAWGAGAVCSAGEADPVAAAKTATAGFGVDVAIDAVGVAATRRAAIEAVRPGGSVVFLGLHEAESSVQANYIVRSETRVVGSFAYTPAEFAEAIAMLAAGEVRPAADWLEERPLTACAASFVELIDSPPAVVKIVLRPQ